MPKYEIPYEGHTYDIESPDFDTAMKDLRKHVQKEYSDEYIKSSEEAPMWAKPLIAASDVGVRAADVLSAGLIPAGIDKLSGDEKFSRHAQGVKDSMGWAGTALDVGTMAKFLPSSAAWAIKKIGGGPAARTITGTTVAGTEGGVYGGVDAATHGENVPKGTALGAGGGILGQGLGDAVNKGVKWLRGIDDTVPKSTIMKLPKNPTKVQLLEQAVNKAEANSLGKGVGAGQKAVQDEIRTLATGANRGAFAPQLKTMEKIYGGDTGTNLYGMAGRALDNKLAAPGMGTAVGFGSGSVEAALAAMALTGAGANAAKRVSAGGTDELVQGLRRWVHGGPHKYVGPISQKDKMRMSKASTRGLLDYLNDEKE